LQNDAASIKSIASTLTGIIFNLDSVVVFGTPIGVTFNAANGGLNFYDCTSGGVCTQTNTFNEYDGQGNATPVSAPYGWGVAGQYRLSPGDGSGLKPAEIVNDNIQPVGSIVTNPHNDFLRGPVTFAIPFTFTGAAPTQVTSATFLFGTGTDTQTPGGNVPEPAGIFLVGTALLGLGWKFRRRVNL